MFSVVNFPSWISPKIVSFLPVRWYGLMYLVAFAVTYIMFMYQCRHDGVLSSVSDDDKISLFFYLIIGLILGGRIFSTLVYDGTSYYWTHPHLIFWPFRNGKFVGLPGMSYHGGAIGAALGCYFFCKKYKCSYAEVADTVLCGTPLGYTFGRIGNFTNGELWGRCTGTSFGMIFPDAELFSTRLDWVRKACDKASIDYVVGDYVNLPRHPSQLYEAFFEGVFLFLLIWFLVRPLVRKKDSKYKNGYITGFYFAFYGIFRFIIEYFREPDSQLGFIIALGKEKEPIALFKSVFNFSLGQLLCFMMIVLGFTIMTFSKKHKK